MTHLLLVDTEAVDNSSICHFLETELELEEPPSTNGDVSDIKLIVNGFLRGDISPVLGCSCFALVYSYETGNICSFHIDPLKAYLILTSFVQT